MMHRSARNFTRQLHSSSGVFKQKTPFQVFVDTFKSEVKKSQELQDSVKQLQDENRRMQQSSAFKSAQKALDRSKAAGGATAQTVRKAGDALGDTASATWNSAPIKLSRTVASKTIDTLEKASEPIKKTKFYQDVRDVIDDGYSINHGGFETRQQRRLRRERLEKNKAKAVQANETAGENVIVHETAKPTSRTESAFSRKMDDLRLAYEESDNGLVSKIRGITDTIGGFFSETEGAKAVRLFKQMDPSFTQHEFLGLLRGYIMPEVLDAYVKGDGSVLKQWFSEAAYNVWSQTTKEFREKNLYSAGRILDIRGTDILQTKILNPAEIPVYVVACRAQETNVYKSIKDDKIEAGVEDKILTCTYVMVLTRVPEDMANEETSGWKILEFARSQR